VRSPIRRGRVDLKDCSIRIGWPFFGYFFWPPKKSDEGKKVIKGNFRSNGKTVRGHYGENVQAKQFTIDYSPGPLPLAKKSRPEAAF
jgi:hypothetical protein